MMSNSDPVYSRMAVVGEGTEQSSAKAVVFASISIASESERDDDESSDSGFDSDGDFRVGDGKEEELKEPEPSSQGRPVRAARQRNTWNRWVSACDYTALYCTELY